MTASSFRDHPVSDGDKVWIAEALRQGGNFDPKVARIKLRDQLPPGFDLSKIDPRLYSDRRVRILGLWQVPEGRQILSDFDRILRAIKTSVIEAPTPGAHSFTAEELSAAADLPPDRVAIVLEYCADFHGFWSGSEGHADKPGRRRITLKGDTAYDPYLRYEGIEPLLESWYDGTRDWGKEIFSPREGEEHEDSDEEEAAFILMAMDPKNPELVDVYNTIRDVFGRFEIPAYRSDDIEHQGSITNVILDRIRRTRYLIADLTYERPNVYYEIGYAHALKKNPILVRKEGAAIHFDLKVHNAPEFSNMTDLRKILLRRLEAILGRKPKGGEAPE